MKGNVTIKSDNVVCIIAVDNKFQIMITCTNCSFTRSSHDVHRKKHRYANRRVVAGLKGVVSYAWVKVSFKPFAEYISKYTPVNVCLNWCLFRQCHQLLKILMKNECTVPLPFLSQARDKPADTQLVITRVVLNRRCDKEQLCRVI